MATMPRVGSTAWSLRRLQGCRHGLDDSIGRRGMAVNEVSLLSTQAGLPMTEREKACACAAFHSQSRSPYFLESSGQSRR